MRKTFKMNHNQLMERTKIRVTQIYVFVGIPYLTNASKTFTVYLIRKGN